MYLADFHIHSTFSDGKMTIPQLIDFYGTRGFGAICITDHLCESESLIGRAARYIGTTLTPANFPMYLEILRTEGERAWDQYGMRVIPGFELSKNELFNDRSAHIVAIGAREFVHADADAVDLCRAIRAQGALAVAAHPVATRKIEKQTYHLWNRRLELAREFDAWEVASGPYIFSEVWRSGLPMIASSDLHVARQINSWKTVLDCERTEEAILQAIREQKLEFKFYADSPGIPGLVGHDGHPDLGNLAGPEAI